MGGVHNKQGYPDPRCPSPKPQRKPKSHPSKARQTGRREILKVNKISQLKYVANTDLHQIGLSKPEIRRYRKIYGKHFPNPYMNKIKKLLIPKTKSEIVPQSPSPSPIDTQPFSESNVIVPTKHIISIEDITINKELGMGQFGVVQQGTWNTGKQRLQVAIKCLGHERMTSNSTEFLKEAAVMHSIEHPNVVRLYGVVLHLDNLMLVTELAPLRSLLECLREVSLRPNFPVPTLCEFAEQICDGMTYLEQKRLIHRDLAARNILVFTKDKVKISDFGLSRALGVGKDYYQTNYNVNLKLPVAWCAPECILYLRFTSASDVWAFGVCLWEMFTYGFQPWAAFSGQQILEAIDAPNCQRLERPECCPAAYYTLMLHCWEHEAVDRPRFKDLCQMLRAIRPEQVQATVNYNKSEDGRRGNFLEYKAGQIITVLNKQYMNTGMWYGVLPGGTCGVFDPEQTKPYCRPEPFPKLRNNAPSALSALPSRSLGRSCRTTRPLLSRSDVKRHTYQGKRTIQRSMISSPQGDVKHTGHVGLDGAYFGDISFLDPAGCVSSLHPPHQVVTPYKPADDMEIPLLNSPSHTKAGRCKPPYPRNLNPDFDEVDLPYVGPLPMRRPYPILKPTDSDEGETSPDTKTKTFKKFSKYLDPTTSKSIINKVKSATLGRSKSEERAAALDDDVHEYHEISDTDTESPTNDTNNNANKSDSELLDSPVVQKGNTDFSESLLKEVDSVFWSYVNRGLDRGSTRLSESETPMRSLTLGKPEKKKSCDTGTMKQMSAHDMKTLDTAVALANEITSKSMTDLDNELKSAKTPTEKAKGLLNFKFPNVSLHYPGHHDHGKDGAGKAERRNFSEEARNVRDIQATLSEESKQAYMSLIEQPTPTAALLSQITDECVSPKPTLKPKPTHLVVWPYKPQPKYTVNKPRSSSDEEIKDEPTTEDNDQESLNELPLPPRSNKTKLVDKPRHIRKYPLKMPAADAAKLKENADEEEPAKTPIIYQNAVPRNAKKVALKVKDTKLQDTDVDECDGGSPKSDTNPFLNPTPGPSSANPFDRAPRSADTDEESTEPSGEPHSDEEPAAQIEEEQEGSLVAGDHVSVEDLLEFADQKPCGRQRGVESDEVRIMKKVLKEAAEPQECLQALELSNWNVHQAIKVMRVKLSIGDLTVSLADCARELAYNNGDVIKASTLLVLCKPTKGQ
ncbi:activated Cdc42 kinase-like isoform X2 [Epargyreus clarus]|uniref:activated Cdc42 kinase-like isoform X2 n=1 Tax=Epargyreus clarus TaxID=520877 RepID=UPI003C2E28F3